MNEILKQLSERVWYMPAHPAPKIQPTVGAVIGDNETVLIDAGNTPSLAHQILAELERIKAPPVAKIIYTHHHWDHVFGACVFGVETVAHSLCKQLLKEEAQKPWSLQYLEAEANRDESLVEMKNVLSAGVSDWDTFRVVVPAQAFEAKLVLEGQGYRLELEHVGGKHAADSITVKVVGEGVVFLGDSFYPPPLKLNPTDTSPDLKMLQSFLNSGYELFIDGHSEPISKAELEAWLSSNVS